MNLITDPHLELPDDFYEALIDTHRDLDSTASHALNARLILLLANHVKVAGKPIAQRTPFATAMTDGRSAPEVDGGKQAEEEIGALWKFVLSNLKK